MQARQPITAMQPMVVASAAHPAHNLIFDAVPGQYSASQFAWRSDWPSTPSYYRAPELIFYREHFHDMQGPGFNNLGSTYRQFDTYRFGTGLR